jgi:hypothetical protein
VFVEDRIPSEEKGEIANVFQTAPDWAIEIISPDSAACRDSGIQRHAKVTKKNSPLFETKDSNRVDNLSRRANGVCLRSFTADTSV